MVRIKRKQRHSLALEMLIPLHKPKMKEDKKGLEAYSPYSTTSTERALATYFTMHDVVDAA